MPKTLSVSARWGNTRKAIIDDWNWERCVIHKWSISNGRSICANIEGKTMNLGRFILRNPDCDIVDHIDGDICNNLESNLRPVTYRQNAQNRERSLGVSYDKDRNKYKSYIRIGNGKKL